MLQTHARFVIETNVDNFESILRFVELFAVHLMDSLSTTHRRRWKRSRWSRIQVLKVVASADGLMGTSFKNYKFSVQLKSTINSYGTRRDIGRRRHGNSMSKVIHRESLYWSEMIVLLYLIHPLTNVILYT